MSSFGDFIALSDVCDKDTASLINVRFLTVSSLRDLPMKHWKS